MVSQSFVPQLCMFLGIVTYTYNNRTYNSRNEIIHRIEFDFYRERVPGKSKYSVTYNGLEVVTLMSKG